MRLSNIHIGTSGWRHKHWEGRFYPKEIPNDRYLPFYAEHFHTVEINESFYRLPEREAFVEWRNVVPPDFIFTVMASRFITHRKRLKESEKPLLLLLRAVSTLNNKLGPILFQLPPGWGFNPERFYDFLESLPSGYRFAFEFRNSSWHNPQAYDALTQIGAAFCIFDLTGATATKMVTADFVYIRLYGPDGPYGGRYSNTALSGWAGAISSWVDEGREVFCYFADEESFAVEDALRLQSLLNAG